MGAAMMVQVIVIQTGTTCAKNAQSCHQVRRVSVTSAGVAIDFSCSGVAMDEQLNQEIRDKRRGRKRLVRAKTIACHRMPKCVLEAGRREYPKMGYWRPSMRSECERGVRPCPFVACRYNLYLDVDPYNGSIKMNFPDLEVWQMQEFCALDIAGRGECTLEQVAEMMNITRERVRQVQNALLLRMSHSASVNLLRCVDE
jgi:hypothetical protein